MGKVLIADDHPLVRDGLRTVVAVALDRCELFEASDLDEVIRIIDREGDFDLVLLDLNMPRMDGRQVLAAIKSDEGLKTIPVVVLTSSAMDRDVNDSYLLGANSVITKPMDIDTFLDAARSLKTYWFSSVRLPQ